jgi:hypothetical protein
MGTIGVPMATDVRSSESEPAAVFFPQRGGANRTTPGANRTSRTPQKGPARRGVFFWCRNNLRVNSP